MLVYRLPRDFDPSKMCSPGEGQDRNQWEADGPGWKGSGPTGLGYPDATTTSKGIVQVDRVGGLAVAAGVASLARPAWWQVHTRRSQWTPRGASRAAQRWFLATSRRIRMWPSTQSPVRCRSRSRRRERPSERAAR